MSFKARLQTVLYPAQAVQPTARLAVSERFRESPADPLTLMCDTAVTCNFGHHLVGRYALARSVK